jgi:DNA-binding GntR family transcriptional regulator
MRHIDHLVETGALRPGDVVGERNIGKAMGVGRVPVREAVRILAGEGLLELMANRSPRLRQVDCREMLEMHQVSTSLTILAMKGLNAQRRRKKVTAELVALAAKISQSIEQENVDDALYQTYKFHEIILQHCGNAYLLRSVERSRLNRHSRSLLHFLGDHVFMNIASHYPAVATALEGGMPDKAGAILEATCVIAAAACVNNGAANLSSPVRRSQGGGKPSINIRHAEDTGNVEQPL